MRVWIDLANSPHVPFFRALTDRFLAAGHQVEVTARDFAETVPLAHYGASARDRSRLHRNGSARQKACLDSLGQDATAALVARQDEEVR